MAMNTQELIERMSEAGQKGGSELNMRSEELQTKQRVARIPSLKKKLKKKSKLLLVLDLAIPFNPETGEVDELFNPSHKFRPAVSATSAALMVKLYASKCKKTKEVLMKQAGVTSWDTSDTDTFTDEDRTIFSKYRVPRLFSMNVVTVNIPAITKDFSRDYAIKVDRDPKTGELVGEPPIALKINKLFNNKIYEQIQHLEDQCASGEINLTDEQKKTRKRDIYSTNPVSDDHPVNWAEIIELPLTANFAINADVNVASLTAEDVKPLVVNSRYSKKLHDKVTSYMTGELVVFDRYFDFFEMDMNCPTDGDEQTKEGKMQIGLNTTFDNPVYKLTDLPECETIKSAVREYLDSDLDIEKEILRSIYVSEYSEDLEQQLIKALPTVFDLDDDFCTTEVLKANKDIISLAFGDEGLTLIEEADAGVSDKASGVLDEAASKQEAKQYDLNSAEFQDGSGVDISEIDMEA